MDYGLNESKQGNKEGWKRVLLLVQVHGEDREENGLFFACGVWKGLAE